MKWPFRRRPRRYFVTVLLPDGTRQTARAGDVIDLNPKLTFSGTWSGTITRSMPYVIKIVEVR